MKNNCDVSGQHGDRAECKGEYESDGCDHWGPRQTSDKCYHYNCGYCHSLTAIRAVIEAEGMKMNCPDCGSEKTLLCDCWKASDHIADASKKVGE